jgi:hypothetical protein
MTDVMITTPTGRCQPMWPPRPALAVAGMVVVQTSPG